MRAESIIPALCLFLAAACAPRNNSPIVASHGAIAVPRLTDDIFICTDNTRLPLKKWLPARPPWAVILALHGFNDYSNFIHDTALFLADQGVAVYAFDQRGFGGSPDRGLWPGTRALAADMKTIGRLLTEQYPSIPLFILGESMGGAVAMIAMAEDNDPLDCAGVILAAPAVWSRSSMPLLQRVLLWIAAHTVPWLQVTGESLKIKASDNTKMLQELNTDPLVIKKTRIDTIFGLANLMDSAYAAAAGFHPRALLLYGQHDEIIPEKPVLEVFARLPDTDSSNQRLIIYKNGYHMLLRDLQADIVRRDLLTWLTKPSGPLPSITEKLSREISGGDNEKNRSVVPGQHPSPH